MTNADKIRNLSDEELVNLLVWGEVYAEELKVPSCDEGCEDCESGCAAECPIEKREKNVREWLQEQEEYCCICCPKKEECKTQCDDLDKYEYTENCPDYSGTKVIE